MEELCRGGAANVRAGVTKSGNSTGVGGLPTEAVVCDIMDAQSLDRAMRDIEVVIHCGYSRFDERTIAHGTRLVLESAIRHGVKRLIYLSSVAVYGGTLGQVDEETIPVSPISAYGLRKQEAEEQCRAAAGRALSVAVVRPALVYGPFGNLWTTTYIRRIVSGHLTRLGSAGEGYANLIYVQDLARLLAHLSLVELPHFCVFNANGPEIPTFNDYFDRLSQALGRGPLTEMHALPAEVSSLHRSIRAFGKFAIKKTPGLFGMLNRSQSLRSLLRGAENAMRLPPNAGEIEYFGTKVVFSTARSRSIGFEARVSLDEGLSACADWARTSGLLRTQGS